MESRRTIRRRPRCTSRQQSGARSSGRRRRRKRERRHACSLLCIVAVAGVLHSTEGTISEYYASNCYVNGGGNMGPLYLECVGCNYTEAFKCLDTLRANSSSNVPTACGINVLTVQPDPTCCPVFSDPGNHRSLDSSTSAYPDALRCLEDAGCGGDKLHTNLVEECVFNQCSQEYACVAAYSGSGRLSPAFGVSVVSLLGSLMLVRIALPGFGPGG